MTAEESVFIYQSTPTAGGLRGMIMDRVERETDMRVLQRLYVFIEQLTSEKKAEHREITVSPRIKALSAVPATEEDFDYKDDLVSATGGKYI